MSAPAFPTQRDENWRYANLRALARARSDAAPAGTVGASALPAPLAGYERHVFVDGRFHAALSQPAAGSPVTLLNAREAGEAFAQLLDGDLAMAGVDFALARINAARGDEVVHVALPGDAAAKLELIYVASAAAATGTSYPRVQVLAGRNARLSLVERHLSAGTIDSAVNSAVDVALASGARVEHTRVQDCAETASVFDTLVAHVGESAEYRFRTATLGGASSRSTAFIKLAGRAARCDFVAASVANGTQTHDAFAEIDHAARDTATRQVFRGIATERGKLAFNGKMIVRANAHDADSDQSLRTLLTGSGAEAAARPQLEIYTDRVRAKHGATTGKLDEQMLFYLLSRGIDRATAQSLLQWAFVEDAISQIEPAELRRVVETALAAQLADVSSLGLLREPA